MLPQGLVFLAEATGCLGGAFLFPAIAGLCRPNHGGRQCWETVPSGGLAWLEGTSTGVRAEIEEEWA
jgi:hypothetical protein